ncbi:MAG: hypothetical protein HYY46_26210 [Deltaproteobacteria bacterium]|nr:hypothetical protein [Deltaproteobacteria bacterium]
MAVDAPKLAGRRIQIAGSTNKTTDVNIIRYAHRVVAQAAHGILLNGGGLVLAVGREPRAIEGDANSPSLIFDWTALEAAASVLRDGTVTWPLSAGAPIVVVMSEKAESAIPDARRQLWKQLLESGAIRVESILPGSRAAALIRQRQAEFGEILVTLGGGTGVEHLTELYLQRRKTAIPLDLPLGASRGDGTGGSERLARESRAEPERFLRMRRGLEDRANAELTGLATRKGAEPDAEIAGRLLRLLTMIAPPRAFYVRLLNRKHERFPVVEAFFRSVVDPVVKAAGFERVEMGTDKTEHGFINVGIFDSLHFASVAVVDLTASRSNCFIELGYAFGRFMRVIVTAEEGTKLPFDTDAIPCHFWKSILGDELRREEFSAFWRKNIDRPPLVCAGVG